MFDFGGAEESWVDFDEDASCGGVYAFFVEAMSFPSQIDAGASEGSGGELAHTVVFAGGDDEVIGLGLL